MYEIKIYKLDDLCDVFAAGIEDSSKLERRKHFQVGIKGILDSKMGIIEITGGDTPAKPIGSWDDFVEYIKAHCENVDI